MSSPVDRALEHGIRNAVNADVDLDGLAVSVRVEEGRAHLTGEVGSFAERLRAVEVATRLAGVGRVRNALTVRVAGSAWRLPDDELADSVRRAVRAAAGDDTVTVAVRRHIVHLSGTLPTVSARARVRHAVGLVTGVDFVDDGITVDAAAEVGRG
jgi:osmotically-inducible protein OsmY